MPAFRKVLVANRGEIACRVLRGVASAGYASVAVCSDADAGAPHVRLADQAVRIGPAPVGESYLSAGRIIAAAKAAGADAVHPGYGFLSENDVFAAACAEAGITFIGPSAEAIRLMGNKAEAKRRMIEAGVPCVPGYQGADQSDVTLAAEAEKIGWPVMVKAAAGGGGRGMRLVTGAGAFAAAVAAARSEAKNAFGSDELILEKAVLRPRHVEIQVMADTHGNVIHLGERDCSVQRRHQKVVEEAPCPVLTPGTREKMGEAAVKAASSIGYTGAGTIEFLLDADGAFYFLEMNTRLQVEHPVTELVTGRDLVRMQLDVAAGAPLEAAQEEIRLTGHAIEVRLYAEDPWGGFLPQTGSVLRWIPPAGEGIRVDHGLREGMDVSSHYDPMLAKIIAAGRDREEARRRLIRALRETVIFGVTTNRDFLISVLEQETFASGGATTAFVPELYGDAPARPETPPALLALAAALLVHEAGRVHAPTLQNWRSTGTAETPVILAERGEKSALLITAEGARYSITADGVALPAIELIDVSGGAVRFVTDGVHEKGHWHVGPDGTIHVRCGARSAAFEDVTYAPAQASGAGSDGLIRAPMSGRIVSVAVSAGDKVTREQTLAVLEAMKMETPITAPADGTVESVSVAQGDQVSNQQILITLAAAGGTREDGT